MLSLTLAQKIGQLLMAGFDGVAANLHITELIERYHLGGVILFKRNIHCPQQLKSLTDTLQRIQGACATVPLMVGIDQEGGMVARIEAGITYLPGAMALAATGDWQAIEDIYTAVGKELRALGIHINFAPDADVNINPLNPVIGVRSFGEQADRVTALMLRAMQGLNNAQIVPVVKHFPGHGDTTVDSHVDLPVLAQNNTRLAAVELAPFRVAVLNGVNAIMSAHIVVPALEPTRVPCTLSHPVLTGLLREKWGFQGVIFTDCLEMAAIAKHYGVVEGAIRAFEAGADVLLISHTEAYQIAFIETMLRYVASGRISEARIDASVQRIIRLKQHYQMQQQIDAPLCEPRAVALAQRLSQRSVTLLRDHAQQLPLNVALKTLVVTCQVSAETQIDTKVTHGSLGQYLSTAICCCDEVVLNADPSVQAQVALRRQANDYQQIIVVSYNAILFPAQAQIINALIAEHARVIVVAGRLPYDVQCFPTVSTFLTAYENRPEAMLSVANVLLGKAVAEGQPPVTL